MSTLENVIMTIIQILYWSSFYRVWDQKRMEATKIPTSTFSPYEILTVIIGVFRIAYNITSSYNHQRELNYFKADMSFFHKLWLMFAHAFFICFRMLVFYSLLCLGTQALVYLLTILSLQFFIYLLAMKEKHDKSTPLLALVVSSVLLLFIYAPASQSSSSKTISRWSYEVIMWVEFIFIVIYSFVHYKTLSEGHSYYWMDRNLNWLWLSVGFGIAVGCFVAGKLMHVLARRMWVYKNWDPREKELHRAIRMVNKDLGTDWEFLGKEKESEEDRHQTIYL